MSLPVNLGGRRFGRLFTLERRRANGRTDYLCRCDCGSMVYVSHGALVRRYPTRSCGCLRRELLQRFGFKHGRPPGYSSWLCMRSRCFSVNDVGFGRYGGRGITVCSRWFVSFPSFLEDMGPRPTAKHSIDRIDNNGHYSCGRCPQCEENGWTANCRWATRREQNLNRNDNIVVEYDGVSLPLMDWAVRVGVAYHVLWKRLDAGWSLERAFTTPLRVRNRRSPA